MYKFDKENHIHSFDDKPLMGTTTVINEVIAKNLTWWASGMAVGRLGWLNSKKHKKAERLERADDALQTIKTMDAEVYLGLLDDAYQAHNERKETAAEDGTNLHAKIESYIKACMELNHGIPKDLKDEDEKMNIFIKWATTNVKKFVWSEMHCYSTELWVGGVSDFGFIDNMNNELFIGDIKSSREAYFSQFLQLAVYHALIQENGGYDKDGNKIFNLEQPIKGYAIFPFGNGVTPSYRFTSDEWLDAAKSVVKIYKLIKSTQ